MNRFEEKKKINLRSSEKVGSKEKMENLEEKMGAGWMGGDLDRNLGQKGKRFGFKR